MTRTVAFFCVDDKIEMEYKDDEVRHLEILYYNKYKLSFLLKSITAKQKKKRKNASLKLDFNTYYFCEIHKFVD